MKAFRAFTCLALLAGTAIRANAAEYSFGPVHGKPGERIRMISKITAEEGTIQRTQSGQLSRGKVTLQRDAELVWTFREADADGTRRGMVRIPSLASTVTTTIDGKTDRADNPSPLVGKMLELSKPPQGDWKFELDGSVPRMRVEDELENFSYYLKRKWYPDYKVALGDSWEFDPVWIKHLMNKDLKDAKTVGTMLLRQVRSAPAGKTALIDVTIRSSGGDFKADGTETASSVVLNGSLVVNLETMLEESLELKGTVTNTVSTATESNTTTLPITMKVTKSFAR